MQVQSVYAQIAQALLEVCKQREDVLQELVGNYNLTVQFLRDIQDGHVPVEIVMDKTQLLITDDGFKLVPPEPEEEEEHASNGTAPRDAHGRYATTPA